MLDNFVTWLDDYLARQGIGAAVRAIVGLLGFAALAGALVGSAAVRSGLLITVIFGGLASMLVLLRDRRRIKQDANVYRRLLAHYCEVIADKGGPVLRVRSWRQVASIYPNGDTREVLKIHAVVLCEELHFLRLRFSAGWEQPVSYQRRVDVSVHGLLDDGTRGTKWDSTTSWQAPGSLEMLAHLHTPARIDDEISFEVDWTWPGKSLPLVMSTGDDFTFEFDRFRPIEFVSYEVILPPGMDVYYDPVGISFAELNGRFSIRQQQTVEGRISTIFTGRELPVGKKLGMRLEVKRNDSPVRASSPSVGRRQDRVITRHVMRSRKSRQLAAGHAAMDRRFSNPARRRSAGRSRPRRGPRCRCYRYDCPSATGPGQHAWVPASLPAMSATLSQLPRLGHFGDHLTAGDDAVRPVQRIPPCEMRVRRSE